MSEEAAATTPFSELAGLDRLIHEPTRLAIAAALSACRSADFLYLQRITGLTKGNLSAHLSKLEEAGLVRIDKGFQGKKTQTSASLTPEGEKELAAYWERLEALREGAARWRSEARTRTQE